MESPYHAGELAVQARAGVLQDAARLAGIVRTEIPARAAAFLAGEQFAVLGAADADGRVWASLLTGAPGVLRAADPVTLHVATAPAPGDPLAETLAPARQAGAPVDAGMLVIDLATRARLRVNGTAAATDDGGVRMDVRQAYWNCPKYIQVRLPISSAGPAPAATTADGPAPRRAAGLTDAQREWVAGADTFFIATLAPGGGADASHRGGELGFVRAARDAAGNDVLLFPDYPGNGMFNTFGNLQVNPAAGLLFVDWDRGATLQLTGSAEVLWEPEAYADFPGAERPCASGWRRRSSFRAPRRCTGGWWSARPSTRRPTRAAPSRGPGSGRPALESAARG